MGKILLICFIFIGFWITTSFGQSEEDGSYRQNEQPFVENSLREIKNPIDFFPNPTPDDLNIIINDKTLQNIEFEVYNIIGNSIKIEIEEVTQNKYKIPLRTLSPGYYLLVVQDKDSRFKQAYKFQKK